MCQAVRPAPYSDDLRNKAVDAVKRGERKIAVCKMIHISRNTLNLWLQREEETGNCKAITNFQKGNRHKITDWDRFREFANQHGGKTQAQMVKLWGENVTQQDISRALAKIGWSRKKRLTATKNAMTSSGKNLKND
jgi:transposase